MCCPVFVPQITDGLEPPAPAPVTEKASVKHLDLWVADIPLGFTLPAKILESDKVTVDGPEMTKVLKSIRSWQISELTLQMVVEH